MMAALVEAVVGPTATIKRLHGTGCYQPSPDNLVAEVSIKPSRSAALVRATTSPSRDHQRLVQGQLDSRASPRTKLVRP